MLKSFITHPVRSTVISVIIVLLGVLGLAKLPIAQYPDISPPTVQVSANYAGANAQVVLQSVITPLEQQINGVEGMTYMTSSATNTGGANISVYFGVGTNPDIAAVDVQNRVSAVASILPQSVTQSGVNVRKQQSSNLLILSLYSDKPGYDQTFLQNYAAINILPQLQRVNGVGSATVTGSAMTYSMRIWLKPDMMAVYKITPSDVTAALAEQNVQSAPGQFGQNDNQSFQYVIRYSGQLTSIEQFGNIVIKALGRGQYLQLKNIARIELGAQSYTGSNSTDGKPSVGISISQTPGSNARQVIQDCQKVIDEVIPSLPNGVKILYLVNINDFLTASISKVLHTLFECFGLVFLVIFIFLQDFRSTLIHGISVPVSITGTFFFLYLLGFSINLLTLFALVLAIGIVVDDAVVVVEAVHSKLEGGYTSPVKASIDAMSEITGAIVSITLVMASVFVPVSFVTGSSGVFYRQFGITLAIAICISSINALTLCPALAALFLRPPDHGSDQRPRTLLQRFGVWFNRGYNKLIEAYSRAVGFLSARKAVTILIIVGFGALFYLLMRSTPSSFVPEEDMGTVFVNVSLPPASSMERVQIVADRVDSIIRTIPAVANTMRTLGSNYIGGSGSAYGMITVRLKPWDQRPSASNKDVITELTKKTAGIRGADIVFMSQPTITGFGTSGGFTIQLQDKGGHTTADFYQVAQGFLGALNQRPEIQYAKTSFNPNFPQYEMGINVPKVKDAGLTVTQVLNAMQVFYGSSYASNFTEFGQQYQVIIQADSSYRGAPSDLNKIYVRGSDSAMVPITEFITLKRVFGPETVSRFDMFNSMSVSGSPNTGFSTGQALLAIQQTAAEKLPAGYGFEYSGISREEQAAGSQTIYIFLLCLSFVYLLLSAQYESYLLPFAVLLSLPVGLSGIFVFAKLFGEDNNIYMQISMIMLIGLLSKNAILIVEFAVERRAKGMGLLEAAIEGGKARLRPILMTSFAFVFGLLPLVISSGVGANGDRSIGTGAIGGMLFGTCLGVFVIPPLFIIFQGLQEKLRRKSPDLSTAIIILLISITVFSCKVIIPYNRPANAASPGLYRDTAASPGAGLTDTITMATIPWRLLFIDTLLQHLIQEGIDNNYDLKIAAARIHEAEANFRQSGEAFFPSLNANASAAVQKSPGLSSTNNYQAFLNSAWQVDIWGKLRSTRRAQLAALLQSDAFRRDVLTQLVSGIALDYFQLMALDQQLQITIATIANRREDVITTRALKESDVLTGAAEMQSQANLYSAEVTLPDIRQSIRQTENALCLLLGRNPGPIIRDSLANETIDSTLRTGLPAQLLSNRPDVQEAEFQLRNSAELTNVARTYFYPALTITGEAGLTSATLTRFFDASAFFGNLVGGLTQPIFANGLNRQRLEVAKAQEKESLFSFQKALLTAGQEVSNALFDYQSAREKIETRAQEIHFLQKSVDYTKELMRADAKANYTDVLTSEQNLLSAQLSGVNDRLQQLQAVVTLYSALGGGWKL
jgi:HAE1 family hydrophobic/amphiphilic exporter-1